MNECWYCAAPIDHLPYRDLWGSPYCQDCKIDVDKLESAVIGIALGISSALKGVYAKVISK